MQTFERLRHLTSERGCEPSQQRQNKASSEAEKKVTCRPNPPFKPQTSNDSNPEDLSNTPWPPGNNHLGWVRFLARCKVQIYCNAYQSLQGPLTTRWRANTCRKGVLPQGCRRPQLGLRPRSPTASAGQSDPHGHWQSQRHAQRTAGWQGSWPQQWRPTQQPGGHRQSSAGPCWPRNLQRTRGLAHVYIGASGRPKNQSQMLGWLHTDYRVTFQYAFRAAIVSLPCVVQLCGHVGAILNNF